MITNAMAAAIGGMTTQGSRFLHIGNNIANSSTTAFKTGDTIFAETLTYSSGRAPSGHRVQPGPAPARPQLQVRSL